MSLSYRELMNFWTKGLRNGNIKKLNSVQRALYRACLAYARSVGKIVNKYLLSKLKPIIETLTTTFKAKALKKGLNWIRRILSTSIPEWAPQIRVWIREESYLIYLGVLRLNMIEPGCL